MNATDLMKPKIVALAAVAGALLALATVPAFAQVPAGEMAPPERVDLPAVLRIIRTQSPRLAVERQAVAIAEAERVSAGAYPNPSISYGRSRPGGRSHVVHRQPAGSGHA